MPQVEISRRLEDGIAEMSGPSTVVIGGGITGLSAAHRLLELDDRRHVIVLESAAAPGGVLRTVRKDGFLIEESADSFLTALPYGLGLCRRVGLEDEVIPTGPARRAFVVSRGKLVPIPDGLMIMAPTRLLPMATTPILSPWGKLRMGLELFVPMRDGEDESLASFAVRRFGREAYERLIQPLVGGMYTGDPERLSVRATMPRFREMERAHGSLIRAALRERSKAVSSDSGRPKAGGSGARYGMFVGLKRGMASLVEALVRKLPAGTVRCALEVERLERIEGGGWRIHGRGPARFALEADAVIVATPARAAGRLLAGVDRELSASLDRISSTSCAIVSLAYRRDQVAHALDGFGFVVPKSEKRQILSGSFSSIKFPGRGPEGTVLLRAFLGGAFHPEVVAWDDDALAGAAAREFADLLGIRGGPILRHISRWPGVMPQYELGHLGLVAAIEARVARHPRLALAGNAYHGVGVPQCIQSGERAAQQIAAELVRVSAADVRETTQTAHRPADSTGRVPQG
jgi:oxygen-dependent protoporphyrinogen oxidase